MPLTYDQIASGLPNTAQAILSPTSRTGFGAIRDFYSAARKDTANQFGYSPLEDDYARNTYAELIRAQYSDYQDRFRPIADILYEFLNPRQAQEAGRQSQALFTEGYDRSQDAARRQLEGLGLQPSQEQQRISGLTRALGEAQAYNQNARQIDDLSSNILGISPRNMILPEGQG